MPKGNEDRERQGAKLQSQYRREMNDWLKNPGGKQLNTVFNDPLLEQTQTSPTLPPPGNEDEAWQQCAQVIDRHDDGLCKAYREGIDTLLVFAGLFSAVVTAFSVESYQWLQKEPDDPSTELLARVVQLLSPNQSTSLPMPPKSDTVGPGLSPSTAARINAYWFLSLTLSLSAALVGILCKEWVREFGRDAGQTPKQYVGLRQMKFEGFEAWKIAEIISTVPLLLQAALWLFILGVLELLGHLHTAVATLISAVAGLALLFYLTTTILPAVQYGTFLAGRASVDVFRWQCAYKSPQAWLVLRLFSRISDRWPRRAAAQRSTSTANSWLSFDVLYHEMLGASSRARRSPEPSSSFCGLAWLVNTMDRPDVRSLVWQCLWGHINNLTIWSPSDKCARVHTDVAHVVGSASCLPLVDAGQYDADTWKSRTLVHVLSYALKTTTGRNDLLLLCCQALPLLTPDDAQRIWLRFRASTHRESIRPEVLYVFIRSFVPLMQASTRRASPMAYGSIFGGVAFDIRLYQPNGHKILRSLCAVSLLWLRDQPPGDDDVCLVLTILLKHVFISIAGQSMTPDMPHLGLYTALMRRYVDLVCSPLPDVNWVDHVVAKMTSGAVRFDRYLDALRHLLQLAFPERSEAGELSRAQPARDDDTRRTRGSPPNAAPASGIPQTLAVLQSAERLVGMDRAVEQLHDAALGAEVPVEEGEHALPTRHTDTPALESGRVRTESHHSIDLSLHWQDPADEDILSLALEPAPGHSEPPEDVYMGQVVQSQVHSDPTEMA